MAQAGTNRLFINLNEETGYFPSPNRNTASRRSQGRTGLQRSTARRNDRPGSERRIRSSSGQRAVLSEPLKEFRSERQMRGTNARQGRTGGIPAGTARTSGARRSTASSGAVSARYDHSVASPRRVLREREREYQLRLLKKRQRIMAAKRRVRNTRILVAATLLFFLFLVYKLVTGVTGYIESSRTAAVQAMQEASAAPKNDTIDLTGGSSIPASSVLPTVPVIQEGTSADTAVMAAAGQSSSTASGGTAAGNAAQGGTGTTTSEIGDPTHVLSGGRYIDITKPMVALTFDDGPKPKDGNRIMDALEKNDGRGTFFLVGNRISAAKDEVLRMAQNGHEIGNHSWDHDLKLSKKGADYIRSEFDKTNAKVAEITGAAPAFIRLPGGIISKTVRSTVGQPLIYWSLDTLDWKSRNAQSVIAKIQGNVKDGDIILMHEIYDSSAEAAEAIIPWLKQQGYQLVTVSELIRFRGASVAAGNGKQYEKFPPSDASRALIQSAQEKFAASGAAASTDTSAANAETQASPTETSAAETGTTAVGPVAGPAVSETLPVTEETTSPGPTVPNASVSETASAPG